MKTPPVTIDRLRQALSYDRRSGRFTWLISAGKAKAGTFAGCLDGQGYVTIGIDGHHYLGHRLAWAYVYGSWPTGIDHRNGNRSDNAILNLREATTAENNRNIAKSRNEKSSKFKGVCWCKTNKTWNAYIRIDRRLKNLGRYGDEITAAQAYDLAATKHFGTFARLNFPQVAHA